MSRKATDWAWRYQASCSTVKLVLLALADRADDDCECYPSVERVEADTGLNRKTVIKATKELEQAGAIIDTGKRKGATQRVKVYRLNLDVETVPKAESFQKRNHTNNGTLNSTKNGTLNSTKNGTQNQSVEPVIEPLIDQPAVESVKNPSVGPTTIEKFFEMFWKHYPTKRAKNAAKKAWLKFMRRGTKSEAEIRFWNNLMLEHHHKQIEDGILGYSTMHAATYINNSRWTDNPDFVEDFKKEYANKQNGAENGRIN